MNQTPGFVKQVKKKEFLLEEDDDKEDENAESERLLKEPLIDEEAQPLRGKMRPISSKRA